MKKFAFTLLSAIAFMASALHVSAQAVTEQTRDVAGYSGVSIAGPFKVRVILGNKEGVKLSVDAEYIDKVETVVDNGSLTVRFKRPGFSLKREDYHVKTADVTIYARTLSSIANAGSGNTTVEGTVTASDFKAILSGSGTITIPTAKVSNELTTRLSGSGSIDISGSAASVSAFISGSGEIKAKNFSTQTASITISGSGNVYIKADKSINATLVGAGNVYYSGNAEVTKHKVGSGSVQKM
ncbi:head GIN domain-containing protein [Mucilaginibacter polytrichastri]|uniref:Putative auto-transporter adhesin head GIN domain-containing protein n=1 Tax=Mucilaginibacter polytrichastri TaxID=1302689 RepID=A0A1Q6A6B5_9SPHI|nr:head GIN domain-containing protein [Mucilaginibacter polytrichastri]OKS89532.1 hypothetical protein RG47T_5016 [Mucilaginibacter polytrichastri]SFS70753.1 Putative auto-transporter adhesin, head GIN domain [Mucilaginibacter polytrichastri]